MNNIFSLVLGFTIGAVAFTKEGKDIANKLINKINKELDNDNRRDSELKEDSIRE